MILGFYTILNSKAQIPKPKACLLFKNRNISHFSSETHQMLHLRRASSSSSSSLTWRTQLKQSQLASQVSSILLQRRNWVPLLQNLNLPFKLTPPLFLQILHRTQQKNPILSLQFFNWAKSNLRFEPDLTSHCHVIHLSLTSGLTRPAKSVLDTLIQTHTVSNLVRSITQASNKEGTDSLSNTLSFVLACYSRKGLFKQGIEVYNEMRGLGLMPSVLACNALLNVLRQVNETRLGWCFYGAMIRNGVMLNHFTWSVLAQFYYKDGKFERILGLVNLGVCDDDDSVFYSLLVDGYSKTGDFDAAFRYLEKMSDAGFSTYGSVLDGACKLGDVGVVERVMKIMVEKKLISERLESEYDSIVKKLCELEKTYAAEMLFKRACDEGIELQGATYGCVLKALSKEVRVAEAIRVYRVICEMGIVVDDSSCYDAFANLLSKEERSEEGFELLMYVIRRGFSPSASELSGFISYLCGKRRWREAEDILNSVLDKGLLPDLTCCSSLVRHYCSTRRIGSAMALHDKMEKFDGSLDVTTYNVLLGGLFASGRVEEAVRVFDYMRSHDLMSCESFTIMIRRLCQVKELRKAMKIHDEMLKKGFKPPLATYKRLIYAFK